ncbi:DoxX family membrane protein [Halovivax sp.]|uniref:DoxX family membrane protein n=1 Tax=Halovivax sp. TaxID=1935978 RepID=UPI0025BFA19F|nr:DoxX family membrane protein [Halovivax sp.]
MGVGRRVTVGWLAAAAALAGWSGVAVAHEEYVVDEREDVALAAFYRDALSDPAVVGPLLAGGVSLLVAAVVFLYARPGERDVVAFRVAMSEYRDYVPWLLRISFGIPLIGAGFGGYFVSPAVEVELRLLQVLLGFLLLFGLGTRLVAVAALVVYLVGAAIEPLLLLQLEMVGGMAAIAIAGSGRPSADHVLQRLAGTSGTLASRTVPLFDRVESLQDRARPAGRYLPTVCRVGLGVTFVYLGASQKLLDPGLALAVVDHYQLTATIPVSPELWVLAAGLTEVALGLALLAGVLTRGVALAALIVFTMTLFALPDDPVLAHVGLYGLASVLLITGGGPGSLDARWARGDPTVAVAPAERETERQQTN